MFRFFVVLSLVSYYLINNASAALSSCPEISEDKPSVRLNITLSSSGMQSFQGTVLLALKGNFIFTLSAASVGTNSPVSAIEGTYTCSSNKLLLHGNTYYFLKLPMSTITEFQCEYICGSDDKAPRTCTASYNTLPDNQAGTYTFPVDFDLA